MGLPKLILSDDAFDDGKRMPRKTLIYSKLRLNNNIYRKTETGSCTLAASTMVVEAKDYELVYGAPKMLIVANNRNGFTFESSLSVRCSQIIIGTFLLIGFDTPFH